ncbi:Y-family DNA polymerase [Clostridium nigeriense]|uniref:Y-family DNA polymerase n=1 Tax=Clostridium nigeriense TaxID=1805470 RepID=UPI003D326BEF
MGKRIIFHIDVNSAYLSFTAIDMLKNGKINRDITKIPSIIGGDRDSRCGVVLAASIPAKEKGIKTGETIYSALKKCPDLEIYPPDFNVYVKCNKVLIELLYEYTPQIQVFSIDEAFIDVSHFKDEYMKKAIEIKERIKNELGFNVNIGISNNKLLAKQAGDFKPKNSIHTLFPDEIKHKLWKRPVNELFSVGKATGSKLNAMNIYTIEDLANYDVTLLKKELKSHGLKIYKYANGIDNSDIVDSSNVEVKGLGNSTTLKKDINDSNYLLKVLLALTEKVCMRLRENKTTCSTVTVSLKTKHFIEYNHQKKLRNPTDSTNEIYKYIENTFYEMWSGEYIRQVGIRLSKLSSNESYQISLFDESNNEKNRKLDNAIDEIRKKYGKSVIMRSTFLNGDIKYMEGGTTEEYSPKISSIL